LSCTSKGDALEAETSTIKAGGKLEGQVNHFVEDVDRMTVTDLKQGSAINGVNEGRKKGAWCLNAL
jgi:hypothetical protein